jgi:hypothetical protein
VQTGKPIGPSGTMPGRAKTDLAPRIAGARNPFPFHRIGGTFDFVSRLFGTVFLYRTV